MILRNGKIYTPFISTTFKKTVFTKNCLICSLNYKKGDRITSCNINKISLHSFHINCLNTIKKYNFNRLNR